MSDIVDDNEKIKSIRKALADALEIECAKNEPCAFDMIVAIMQTAVAAVVHMSDDKMENFRWGVENFVMTYNQLSQIQCSVALIDPSIPKEGYVQ